MCARADATTAHERTHGTIENELLHFCKMQLKMFIFYLMRMNLHYLHAIAVQMGENNNSIDTRHGIAVVSVAMTVAAAIDDLRTII